MMERKYPTASDKNKNEKAEAPAKKYPWEKADATSPSAMRDKVSTAPKKVSSSDYRDEYLRQKESKEGSTGGFVASEERIKGNTYAQQFLRKKEEGEKLGAQKRAQDEVNFKIRQSQEKGNTKAYEESRKLAQKAYEEQQRATQKAIEEQQQQNQKAIEEQQRQNEKFFEKQNQQH